MRAATYVGGPMSYHPSGPTYTDGWGRSVGAAYDLHQLTCFAVRHPLATIRATQRSCLQETAQLLTAVERLSAEPQAFLADLWSIRHDKKRSDAVVARSYWHRNGFAKIRLPEREGFARRLHIWPEGEDRRGDMNPHGHRWNFASWLLTGQGMIEKHYAETAAQHEDAVVCVRSDYGRKNGDDYLKDHHVAYLFPIAEYARTAGIYTCGIDVIHTIDPIGTGFMATVVLQGKAKRKSTYVYLKPDGEDEEERPRPIGADKLHHLLDDLEIAMGAAPRR